MIRWLLCCLAVLMMPLTQAANINDEVRVQLWHAYQPPTAVHVNAPGFIQSSSHWQPLPETGVWLVFHHKMPRVCLDVDCRQAFPADGTKVLLKTSGTQPLHLSSRVQSRWGSKASAELTRYYSGTITATGRSDGWSLVNRVSAQTYVTSVVASETLPGWPLEALKVHSVLIQTRLRKHSGVHVDSTEDQRYAGELVDAQPTQARQAVLATWGEWLSKEAQTAPVEVFFHSACAGHTSLPDTMSLKRIIAQREAPDGVVCRDCQHSPFWREHTAVIPWAQWTPVFGKGVPKIVQQDATGRPLWVRLSMGKELSGYDLWLKLGQRFGWDKCPGRRYGFSTSKAGMVVTSTGAGHGVGVCQWGAAQKAREGEGYREILKAYYPTLMLHSPKK